MALIMIVEDSKFQRNRIRETLKEQGHEVVECINGKEALEQLASSHPDCIISDLLMPEMDGIEFLNVLKKKNFSVPVIIHSADIQETVRKQCLELGARAFLQKPLNKELLLKELNSVLTKKKTDDGVIPYRIDTRDILNEYQTDVLLEFINIGVGKAASVLTEMVERPIKLHVPSIRILSLTHTKEGIRDEEIQNLDKTQASTIELGFAGPIMGKGFLSFQPQSSLRLITALTGEEINQDELESVETDTLLEVGNIVLNSVLGSISNILGESLKFTVPAYNFETLRKTVLEKNPYLGSTLVLSETTFIIQGMEITGEIFLVFDMDSFKKLIAVIVEEDQNA